LPQRRAHRPPHQYARNPAFVPAACFCIVNARGWRKNGDDGA
jgi:hypothetical protein